jgi:hypothetical protein
VASQVTPIKISDEDFLIASTIERCPKVMMLRELIMNAIEAARLAPAGHRRIEIRTTNFKGTPKLTIWNSGPGLNGHELIEICDLASSIRKQKGLDQNFGMGAKVASLPSNKIGMRYRSCSNGRVHEVILCQRDGVYGKLRYKQDDGSLAEVIDVTEIVAREGQNVAEDWTEVTLLGNRLDQDTAKDPYDGDPDCDAQWLATYLYHRFYRAASEVKITLATGTHKLGEGTRTFQTIPDRISSGSFDKAETVTADSGIKIHYIYDGPYAKSPGHNRSISGAIQSSQSTCAIVYKNEMYDVRKGRAWSLDAPLFGLHFGARHFSVHIEIPDQFPVQPEGYRQFLRYKMGDQEQLYATGFAEIVARNRPQWLIDLIKSFAPSGPSNEDIRKELQKLLDELRVQQHSPRVKPDGVLWVKDGEGPSVANPNETGGRSDGRKPREVLSDLSVAPEGARRADVWQNRQRAPIIIQLYSEEEIEEKQIRERAGRYYDMGTLYVNMLYPSIQKMIEILEQEYADVVDIEQVRDKAKILSEQTVVMRVGRAVVFALAKQANSHWDAEAVKQALTPESLSLAADDFHDALQTARRKMGIAFRTAGNSKSLPDQTEAAE